ncbi:MAG TPA: DinB family protein [Usitatibacter sp.]|jgi:hypothetical protein|nr:DinB family protein [Usitatibacter sp.]
MMNTVDVPRFSLAESIERLESMPTFLDAAILAVAPEDLASRPGPEEFSLVEHACHLRDLEREGYLVRVRRVLAGGRPALQGYDGAAVAAARNYPAEDARLAAQAFAAARRELVGLLAATSPGDLAREATFDGSPVCLADVVAMMVEHDRGHREEIERLMDFLEE